MNNLLPCKCGCGELTKPSPRNRISRGVKKGEAWYILGHRRRWRKGLYKSIRDRYFIDQKSGCWNWKGYTNYGYAHGSIFGKNGRIHRIFFEHYKEKVPPKKLLHHICHNKRCINPEHLEAVSDLEHQARHPRTHCKRGHEFTEQNTRIYDGKKHCRTCACILAKVWRSKRIFEPISRRYILTSPRITDFETIRPTPPG